MAKLFGHAMTAEERALMVGMLDLFQGEFAFAGAAGAPMGLTALYQVSDARATAALMDRMYALFGSGMSVWLGDIGLRSQHAVDKTPIDGVRFRRQTTRYDFSKLSRAEAARQRAILGDQQEARVGIWDDVLGMVTARDTLVGARRLVAVSRGKATSAPLAPAMVALIDEARARRDAMVFLMDLAGLAAATPGGAARGPGVLAMTLNFADGRAHLRIALPAATVRALQP